MFNPYIRFQNSFHQFIIYEYWNRPINYSNTIVDNILKCQDHKGHFAPWPGGSGCYDYDAIHTLIKFGLNNNYKEELIIEALNHNLKAQQDNQNHDGGFCESRERPYSIMYALNKNNLKFILNGDSIEIIYQRMRHTLSVSRVINNKINNHWSDKSKYWDQSDLWNTWFRTLSIAEIISALNEDDTYFSFHKFVGLGYNNIA